MSDRRSPTSGIKQPSKPRPIRMASKMLISQKTTTNLNSNSISFENSQSITSLPGGSNQTQHSISAMSDETRKIIDMLKKEVETLKYELTNSETEKETYVFQIGEIKKKNRRDTERLEQELHDRKEKQHSMEEKLSRVEQIEDGI